MHSLKYVVTRHWVRAHATFVASTAVVVGVGAYLLLR